MRISHKGLSALVDPAIMQRPRQRAPPFVVVGSIGRVQTERPVKQCHQFVAQHFNRRLARIQRSNVFWPAALAQDVIDGIGFARQPVSDVVPTTDQAHHHGRLVIPAFARWGLMCAVALLRGQHGPRANRVGRRNVWIVGQAAIKIDQIDAAKAATLIQETGLTPSIFDWDAPVSRNTQGEVFIPTDVQDLADLSSKQIQWLRQRGQL